MKTIQKQKDIKLQLLPSKVHHNIKEAKPGRFSFALVYRLVNTHQAFDRHQMTVALGF